MAAVVVDLVVAVVVLAVVALKEKAAVVVVLEETEVKALEMAVALKVSEEAVTAIEATAEETEKNLQDAVAILLAEAQALNEKDLLKAAEAREQKMLKAL